MGGVMLQHGTLFCVTGGLSATLRQINNMTTNTSKLVVTPDANRAAGGLACIPL